MRACAGAVAACREALLNEGSVGLIAADDAVPGLARRLEAEGVDHISGIGEARLVLLPATQVKGLEFDHVVVVEPARIAGSEPYDLHRLRQLYVALTRAVSGLCVLHAEPLPAPLATVP